MHGINRRSLLSTTTVLKHCMAITHYQESLFFHSSVKSTATSDPPVASPPQGRGGCPGDVLGSGGKHVVGLRCFNAAAAHLPCWNVRANCGWGFFIKQPHLVLISLPEWQRERGMLTKNNTERGGGREQARNIISSFCSSPLVHLLSSRSLGVATVYKLWCGFRIHFTSFLAKTTISRFLNVI